MGKVGTKTKRTDGDEADSKNEGITGAKRNLSHSAQVGKHNMSKTDRLESRRLTPLSKTFKPPKVGPYILSKGVRVNFLRGQAPGVVGSKGEARPGQYYSRKP